MKTNLCVALAAGAILVLGAVGCGGGPKGPAKVLLKTTLGEITLELDAEKAPVTVRNFLGYVESGFYDGTIFHRVIPGFMIQGGGLTADMVEKPTKPAIANEAGNGLKNLRYAIAMARTGEVHSATSQFFINHDDNAYLDHRDETIKGFGYCVFGRATAGLEVVDAIAAVPTGTRGMHENVPLQPVTILSASVIQ